MPASQKRAKGSPTERADMQKWLHSRPVGGTGDGDPWFSVLVDDRHAFAGGLAGFVLVDISDVSDFHAPRVIRTLEGSNGAWGIRIVDDRLYIGSFDGILIYDISSYSDPVLLGRLLESEETLGLCLDGNQLITTVAQGVKALDISDLDAVKVLAFFKINGGCHAIRCTRGHIYTVRGGLYVLQLRPPARIP